MSNVQLRIQALARTFVDQVIDALRGASLHELGASSDGPTGNGRRTRATPSSAVTAPAAAAGTRSSRPTGRLPRRSAEEIAAALDKIVTLVRKHKGGLRAEEIRANLGMQAKEMPRILKEGVSAKKLTSKGQKRATTYFAR